MFACDARMAGCLVVAAGGALMAGANMDVRSPWFFIGLTAAICFTVLAAIRAVARHIRVDDDILRDVWDIGYTTGYDDGHENRAFAGPPDAPSRCRKGASLRSMVRR
ncbi:MAG: hypothetical protein ACRDUV_13450 [Pseudonocardiaceae bacterium]